MFFALKGDNFNGNLFADEALTKGASYAIVDEIYSDNPNVFLVDNVLKTLQDLANYHRKELGIPVIALTGSNGKTTTKELINCVLSKKFKTYATQGNLNNHIGVPLTLLSIDKTIEFAVVEMGANHIGEIAKLTLIVEPDYGYITNFGKAHLEGFGSEEGVIKGKSELYRFIKANNKTVFVNQQDEKQVELTEGFNRLFFDDSISFLKADPFVEFNFNKLKVSSNLIGFYNYTNIAIACTIGKYFKIDTESIIDAIKNYIPSNNRSQVINTPNNTILLDAYNANPSSMEVAITNFKNLKSDSKYLILGDMFELGVNSLHEHQKLVDKVKLNGFKEVYLLGENFFKTDTNYNKFKRFNDFKNAFENNQISNAYFLIKGSRGMALERVLEFIN